MGLSGVTYVAKASKTGFVHWSKAGVTIELSAGCAGNKWSHYGGSGAEGEAAKEHLRTSNTPTFPQEEVFYNRDRQRESDCSYLSIKSVFVFTWLDLALKQVI